MIPLWFALALAAAPQQARPSSQPAGGKPSPQAPGAVPRTPAAGQGGPGARPREYTVFDRVLAIIGERVVTESRIRDALEVALEAERRDRGLGPNGRLPPETVERIRRDLVRAEVEKILQADRTAGLGIPEDALERWIQSKVDEIVEDRRRQAGSWPAFVKNLERAGLSVQDFREREALRLKLDVVRQQQLRNLIKGGALHVTPREMWREFEAHRDEFARPAEAVVEILRYEDRPGRRARETAARALAYARAHPKAPLPADLAPDGRRTQRLVATSAIAKPLKDFAFDPKVRPGAIVEGPGGPGVARLLRLKERTPAKTPDFLDPEVQRRLVERLRRRRFEAIRAKLLQETLRRVQTWPPDLFRE